MSNEKRAREWLAPALAMDDADDGDVTSLAALLDEAEARGRAEERARIVAWLRGPMTSHGDMRNATWCADAIERGEAAAGDPRAEETP